MLAQYVIECVKNLLNAFFSSILQSISSVIDCVIYMCGNSSPHLSLIAHRAVH